MTTSALTRETLATYQFLLVNSSAGKDSQAMLDYVAEVAGEELRDRIVVVHADLGRVEWEGTGELAAEQAAHYGFRFIRVKREQNDLLDQVEARGMWPSSSARYCTSDHKRGPVMRVMTQLADEARKAGHKGQVRILNCLGMRAEESPARSKLVPFENDARNTNGRRHVDVWLPIHAWKVADVWQRIFASGVRHHRAYDLGMPRLSCAFCIFAPKAALLLAGKHNRALLDQYVAVETKIGHTFKQGFALAEIAAMLDAGVEPEAIQDWTM